MLSIEVFCLWVVVVFYGQGGDFYREFYLVLMWVLQVVLQEFSIYLFQFLFMQWIVVLFIFFIQLILVVGSIFVEIISDFVEVSFLVIFFLVIWIQVFGFQFFVELCLRQILKLLFRFEMWRVVGLVFVVCLLFLGVYYQVWSQ